MGKMPDVLRETIARNIRHCRMHKYPGRGGGKKCAESFGVSPQQWSPWESGKRTPDEFRLEQIAAFFGRTVEWFCRDHRSETAGSPDGRPVPEEEGREIVRTHVLGTAIESSRPGIAPRHAGSTDEEDINHYLWLIDMLHRKLTSSGIRIIVTIEKATSASA